MYTGTFIQTRFTKMIIDILEELQNVRSLASCWMFYYILHHISMEIIIFCLR